MILTGDQIHKCVRSGEIVITPFRKSQLSPNSYDFRLGKRCCIYSRRVLDSRHDNPTERFTIPSEGILLRPSRIYLVNTLETMGSTKYVPIIRGRSSTGRLGLFIDITADLIDLGAIMQYTLQLHCVVPVRIFPGMVIGQITFWQARGRRVLYRGKYSRTESPVRSLAFKDTDK